MQWKFKSNDEACKKPCVCKPDSKKVFKMKRSKAEILWHSDCVDIIGVGCYRIVIGADEVQ
jgi:hypothetical protein